MLCDIDGFVKEYLPSYSQKLADAGLDGACLSSMFDSMSALIDLCESRKCAAEIHIQPDGVFRVAVLGGYATGEELPQAICNAIISASDAGVGE